eukprot:4072518-Pyramimonas_sp.AAC.1
MRPGGWRPHGVLGKRVCVVNHFVKYGVSPFGPGLLSNDVLHKRVARKAQVLHGVPSVADPRQQGTEGLEYLGLVLQPLCHLRHP